MPGCPKVPSLAVRCETDGCPKNGDVINRIRGIESEADRALMVEQWTDAHDEEDFCDGCGVLGVPDEDEPCIVCQGKTTATPFPCKTCDEPVCQDCEDVHTCEPE